MRQQGQPPAALEATLFGELRGPPAYATLALVTAGLLVYTHRANLRALRRG